MHKHLAREINKLFGNENTHLHVGASIDGRRAMSVSPEGVAVNLTQVSQCISLPSNNIERRNVLEEFAEQYLSSSYEDGFWNTSIELYRGDSHEGTPMFVNPNFTAFGSAGLAWKVLQVCKPYFDNGLRAYLNVALYGNYSANIVVTGSQLGGENDNPYVVSSADDVFTAVNHFMTDKLIMGWDSMDADLNGQTYQVSVLDGIHDGDAIPCVLLFTEEGNGVERSILSTLYSTILAQDPQILLSDELNPELYSFSIEHISGFDFEMCAVKEEDKVEGVTYYSSDVDGIRQLQNDLYQYEWVNRLQVANLSIHCADGVVTVHSAIYFEPVLEEESE